MLSSHLFTVYYTNRARVLVTFLFRLFLWIHALEKTLGKDIKKHIYIQEWLVMISFKSISQFLQCGTTKRFLFLLGKISVHCGVTPKYNSTITMLWCHVMWKASNNIARIAMYWTTKQRAPKNNLAQDSREETKGAQLRLEHHWKTG